jgi:hypothetical protein
MMGMTDSGEHTHRFGIDLKSEIPFCLGPVNCRVCGCVDAHIRGIGLKKIPNQVEMMDGHILARQEAELMLRVMLLEISKGLTQLSVGSGDEDFHVLQD